MLSAPDLTAAHHGLPDRRVALARAGDEAAFGELVREHQTMIHALAYRMTGAPLVSPGRSCGEDTRAAGEASREP